MHDLPQKNDSIHPPMRYASSMGKCFTPLGVMTVAGRTMTERKRAQKTMSGSLCSAITHPINAIARVMETRIALYALWN